MADQLKNKASHKRIASVSRGSSAYARKRSLVACQVCRARRTRCDQKKPKCSFCQSVGTECITEAADFQKFDPASLAILDRLERLESKLDVVGSVQRAGSDRSPLPWTSSERRVCTVARDMFPTTVERVLQWRAFDGVELSATPGVDGVLTPTSSIRSENTVFTAPDFDPSLCNELLDRFFTDVHPKNPVLDRPSAQYMARKVCQNGIGWDIESCLTLLLCANGALIRPYGSPSLSIREINTSIAASLFAAAQKRLGAALVSSEVIHAQSLFFAGVYLASILRPFDAWRCFLQTVAICQSWAAHLPEAGLGQTSTSFPRRSAEESIYWSAWKSERELRFELVTQDFENTIQTAPASFPLPPEGDKDACIQPWYFYLSEISLWRLETEAKAELQELTIEKNSDCLVAVAKLSAGYLHQTEAWKNSLASSVKIVDDETDTFDDILRFVLRGRSTYMYELITWPFIHVALNDSHSLQHDLVKEWVVKGALAHYNRLSINRPGFYYRHHGTWLMMRSSTRSACVLLGLATLPCGAHALPHAWREIVMETAEMLRYWGGEIQSAYHLSTILDKLLAHTAHTL